jgi:two-component system, cell cycle sensor histidine kinase and response regulator CckA
VTRKRTGSAKRTSANRRVADSLQRLNRLNECLLSFGPDPDQNINRLVALCGEELGATVAVYNRLEGKLLVAAGRWHTAPDFPPADRADGHICTDVITDGQSGARVIRHLERTPYADTDPAVRRHGLKTYIGNPVSFGGNTVGSLCVLYQRDVAPAEADLRLLGIAAAAIGVEETRKHSEDRIRMLAHTIRSIGELVSITDLENRVLYVNDAFLATYGYTAEELMGRPIGVVRSRQHPQATDAGILNATQQGGWQGELLNVRKDGTEFLMSLSTSVVRDDAGKAIALVGIGQDITEQRRADRQLKEAERRYREMFDENLAGLYVSTPEGRLLACNAAYARIFRFSSIEDALSASPITLYPHPDVRNRFLERLQRERKLENYEMHLVRRDGTSAFIVENVIGKFDERGELVEFHGYVFDETKRRELEQQLVQSQKLQGVGTLAGGIAHDFNNLLGIILGHTTFLREKADGAPEISRRIEAMHQAAERGAGLVKQLLTFARKSEPLVEPVNLNDIVEEISRLLHETFPRTIEVVLRRQPALPFVTADATQMHQVLLNLCVNARDAMPAGGTLTLVSGTVRGEELRDRFASAHPVEYVLLRVTDTGTGMDEATRLRIFEPFFTTKGPGKGTGLGLSLVFGAVETHHGFIDVESTPGEGTAFSIYLPAAVLPAHSRKKEAPKSAADVPGGTETILLIEDEAMLGDLLAAALTGKGYRMLRAHDGQEGIEQFARHRTEIDLVITDIGLPVVGGAEVFRRIRAIEPAAKIILASGYIDPDLKAELQQAGASHFVQKPFAVSGVLATVRDVLDHA